MLKTRFATLLLMMVLLISVVSGPVAAQTSGNIICEYDDEAEDGPWIQSPVGSLLGIVTQLLVTIAGLVAVVGGAGFTLASAARPGESDYVEKRNKAVLYGGGSLVVLYGANALISQLSADLDFQCILPFL